MKLKSLKLFAITVLGAEYLLLGAFGFFTLAKPMLASAVETPYPAQEVLWAAVYVPKPTATPTQTASPQPTITEAPTDVVAPQVAMEIVDLSSTTSEYATQDAPLPDDGRWIDVNLSEQQTFAYEGDVLVNSFIVSTGLPDTPTVTGEFRIYVKVPIQDMSGPGYFLPDVPWVMYFYDEYGFHGTYWHNNFGTPMSSGCVNLRIADAKWLYNWASVGTPVSVHY